jgi:hypothetical protein
MQISYAEFFSKWEINVENTDRNAFTPLCMAFIAPFSFKGMMMNVRIVFRK